MRRFRRKKKKRTSEDKTQVTHLGMFRAEQRRQRKKLEGTKVREPRRFIGRTGERKVGAVTGGEGKKG